MFVILAFIPFRRDAPHRVNKTLERILVFCGEMGQEREGETNI